MQQRPVRAPAAARGTCRLLQIDLRLTVAQVPCTTWPKRIVVVDDVITTGATVAACAKVLKRAGAARVDVLALARAVEPTAFVL